MSNDPFYNPDEPTLPVRPSMPQQPQEPPQPQWPQQGSGEKLILGNFKNPPKPAQRAPYQYPPPPSPPLWQEQNADPATFQTRPQTPRTPRQPVSPGRALANETPSPTVAPDQQSYPYYQPSQGGQTPPGGATQDGDKPKKPKGSRRKKGCLIGCLSVLLLLCVAGGFFAVAAQRVLAFGSAISTQTPLSTQTGYIGGTDRVNILVMGYGGSGHDGAYLTDSMMVMSILPQSHHTTLLSVPRDLWVQIPANSGQYHKINYAYVDGSNNGANPV